MSCVLQLYAGINDDRISEKKCIQKVFYGDIEKKEHDEMGI